MGADFTSYTFAYTSDFTPYTYLPSTTPPNFHVDLTCTEKIPVQDKKPSQHHPSSPCCPPRPPCSARSLLDLARLDLAATSDLCVNIAFVSASNLAIRSAFARSRPAYLQKRIFVNKNCRFPLTDDDVPYYMITNFNYVKNL